MSVPGAPKLKDVLEETGKTFGSFVTNAQFAQRIKVILRDSPAWGDLADDQREALEQIATEIAIVLSGNINYEDSWRHIAAYANLVANRLAVPVVAAKVAPGKIVV